jgi:glycosyltransferase involved in cell wall biosynthesis
MPGRALASGMISRLAIRWLKLLRFRIVWTVHNVLPHEPQTDDDRAIARLLADSADVLIVHSSAVRKTLALQGIPDDGAVVIPQGSYIGHYRPAPSQPDARRALGLPEEGRVLLFFGLIRSYKGIPELLKAWSDTAPPGRLLVAGSCSDPSLQANIRDTASQDPSVHGHMRFIPDEEVPTFFAASDGVCLPFRTVTTSSTALMALSFGKPLIAPRIGALEDLPEEVGFFYGDGTGSTLGGALDRFFGASEAELENASRSALEYAEQLSWPVIAARTFEVYASVSPSTHS